MMDRVLAALVLVAALSAAGMGWMWKHTSAKLRAAEDAVAVAQAQVKAEQALVRAGETALAKRTQALKLSKQQHQKELNALSASLARNPDWAAGDVPPDVAAALGVQRPTPAP